MRVHAPLVCIGIAAILTLSLRGDDWPMLGN